MPKSRIMIQLEPETIEQVDKIRGAVPRAAWVRLLIEDRLDLVDKQMDSDWEAIVYRGETTVSERPEKAVRQQRGPVGDGITDDTEAVQALQDKPQRRRKPKACKHTNQIRKLGAAFCTDCGEFV